MGTSFSSADPAAIITVEIEDIARGGAGVGREPSGRVVFVPFTAPGDRVKARILQQDKRFAHAELVEVLEPSKIRQTPRCPAFGRCGGCDWQHLPYTYQWEIKKKGVLAALKRAGVSFEGTVEEFPAEQIWEYRNRVQLRGRGRDLGYFAPRSHRLVPVDRCDIAAPGINAAWEQAREHGAGQFGSGEEDLFKVEIAEVPGQDPEFVWNSPHGAAGFRQVHAEQNEKLRAWVSAAVDASGKRVFDLFGGSGNLSKGLVPAAESVDVVDRGAPAEPADGVKGIGKLRFHQESVGKWIRRELRRRANPLPSGVAVLDPPRAGLGRDFELIADGLDHLGVTEVAAIGCDPDSLASDLRRWISRGWSVRRLAVFDFFPQTRHVETAVLLKRGGIPL